MLRDTLLQENNQRRGVTTWKMTRFPLKKTTTYTLYQNNVPQSCHFQSTEKQNSMLFICSQLHCMSWNAHETSYHLADINSSSFTRLSLSLKSQKKPLVYLIMLPRNSSIHPEDFPMVENARTGDSFQKVTILNIHLQFSFFFFFWLQENVVF